jgi:hypothetical protein
MMLSTVRANFSAGRAWKRNSARLSGRRDLEVKPMMISQSPARSKGRGLAREQAADAVDNFHGRGPKKTKRVTRTLFRLPEYNAC